MTACKAPEALISLAQKRLKILFKHAQEALLSEHNALLCAELKIPRIELGQRGKVAGSAHLQHNLIKLNTLLFEQNKQYFLDEVIAHELAHILVYQLYGPTKPHGKEWQHIMRSVFERIPHTKHGLDISNIGIKQVAYKCGCDTVYLSMTRHNKIIKGKQQYVCKKCRQTLRQSSE
ncbi:SprT family zinc-dependent metalloprotease [Glaciecola petra]|uniref:SprT family zinc-dependent metalloprotease n=1 Tax=Glaciecola petra TaxID=3075602 RepID=A0ABU2ZNM7_9ALTE|nr:SprT family zinc-dependent metalloprotease [Aestuariibacter sp. P117]MDT0594021.1 SprT family zinc-dependent metalloprotease [Aestuariibacter sp. P117]